MARAKFNPCEIDPNCMIEDAISDTLRAHPIAEAPLSVIEQYYDLIDEDCNPIDGTLEDKCRSIATRVHAEFEIRTENVLFRKPLFVLLSYVTDYEIRRAEV